MRISHAMEKGHVSWGPVPILFGGGDLLFGIPEVKKSIRYHL